MASLPALSRAYHTRANIPFGANNTTALLIQKFAYWALKACMKNEITTGTTGGSARAANSIWTCIGSSDGVTAALDGTDRWTSTFDQTKIVAAANGSAHSWIVLQNLNVGPAGMQVCIDVNSTGTSVGISAARANAPFTGGSTTTRPLSTGEEFGCGFNGNAIATSGATLVADIITGNTNFVHFTVDGSGRFTYLLSRSGFAMFTTIIALVEPINGRAADTRNIWWIGAANITNDSQGNGVLRASQLSSAGPISRRGFNAGVPVTQGSWTGAFGGSAFIDTVPPTTIGAADAVTGDFITFPVTLLQSNPGPVWCGEIPDWYFIAGGAATGSTVNNGATQERVVVGHVLMPFMGVAPNI